PFGDDDNGVTVGFHVTGPDAEYIAFYAPDGEPPLRFAAHEYTHAVVSRSLGDLPVWVNEGLAEYYSTFQPRRRGADIGVPIPEHVAWLRTQMQPLDELLLTSRESPDYTGGARRGTIYAESWALVHALTLNRVDSGRRFGS